MPQLDDIVRYLDRSLRTSELPDYSGAFNGLQFANRGTVGHVAAAVDYSLRSLDAAIAFGANLLLVHHGMLWGGQRRIVGATYEQVRRAIDNDIAVYASHLPLDVHPSIGNNALLADRMGLAPTGGFARFETITVGLWGACDIETEELVRRATLLAEQHHGTARTVGLTNGRRTRRWGICSGAGASSETLAEARDLGLDTLIVGEGPHHTGVAAYDLGLVVIYAGHYATETLGVRALAELVSAEFHIGWDFVDAPTGL
jgi:dinuclear metal center YbgI/SA1388 family protein